MSLPAALNKASPANSDNPSAGAANVCAFKTFIQDVFGITDNTNYTAAAFSLSTAGVVTVSVAGLLFQNGTAAAPSFAFASSATTGLYRSAASAIGISNAGVSTGSIGASGQVALTPQALSGTPATTGSYFNIAAATFTDSATAGSGTAAAFAAFAFQRPTLAATNATVTTTAAATVYIANAPAAGTNQTLTNAYALWIDDGLVRFDGVVRLGEISSTTGGLAFCHASSAYKTTFQSGNASAAVTYTLPAAGPATNGEYLVSTTAGVMSWTAGALVPTGAISIMFFNYATCPTGWTEYTALRGKYVVGLPSLGTLAGGSGTALTDQESRPVGQHTHTEKGNDGVTKTLATGTADYGWASVNTGASGNVAGTNAPYHQLLACSKD